MNDALQSRLIEAILNADRELANSLLDKNAAEIGASRTVSEVLEPVLTKIGEYWDSTATLSLAQAYVAAKISEDFLRKSLSAEPPHEGQKKKGPVILGNIEDDYHSLGRNMISIFLKSAGWEVIDLGNDVVASAFVDTAIESGARIIGVSAMMYSTASNIIKLHDEIQRRMTTDRPKLAVGGAVFKLRPELVQEVGGDGTASNAIQVPPLFDRMCGY